MKKVLSIVYNEIHNDNRVLNQAISLKNNGYDVTVLGIKINKETKSSEEWKGVNIKRINIVYRNPLIHRIPFLKPIYHWFNVYLRVLIHSRRANYIHCHDLDTLQYGVTIKRFKKGHVKLIYDAHEYETEKNGLNEKQKVEAKRKESKLICSADRVITVSNTIANEYVKLYNVRKPIVILNCPPSISSSLEHKNLFRKIFNINETQKILLYQGILSKGRGINILLNSFEKLDQNKYALIFLGKGEEESIIKKSKKFGKFVFIHPFVPGDVLLSYTSSADYGIAFIEDISLSDRFCLPNKLFEYIAAGLPVVGSGLPEMKSFIESNKVGVVAETNDITGFLNAFQKLSTTSRSDFKKSIDKARGLYNWSSQEIKLIDLYREL